MRFNHWRERPRVELIQLDSAALADNTELTDAVDAMNTIIAQYDVPAIVLSDVQQRLNDCPDNANYALQQLRYLKNLISSSHIRRKEAT